MKCSPKNLYRTFASASLGFVVLLTSLLFCSVAYASSNTNSSAKREAASSQFSRAEDLRSILNAKTPDKRTLAEYKKVVASYQRVYLITPHAMEVPEAILAVAELDTEMGDRFGRSYYQSAVEAYQFLIRNYPTSKYVQESMLRASKLEKDQLGEPEAAAKIFQDFLKAYPRSPRRREVQEALAELALLRSSESATGASRNSVDRFPAPARTEARDTRGLHSGSEAPKSGAVPLLRRVRTNATPDSTEVIIELDEAVQYASGRIANPDRIYFDLHARVAPSVLRNNVHVNGGLLTKVRVAQYQSSVVRVVLDVSGVKDYAASLTKRPARLLIELYGAAPPKKDAVQTAKENRTAKTEIAPSSESSTSAAETNQAESSAHAADAPTPGKEVAAAPEPVASKLVRDSVKNSPTPPSTMVSTTAKTDPATVTGSPTRATVPRSNANSKPETIQPATAPQPTRGGQSTLTRALGLKIGRIVIDAGHGGHDTGTIGPTGLMEKDLCLDVALRLGKIIQQKLPGAEIVYTRSDDTFIPLEERTRIANEAKADLFVSIHANSSPDRGARGIETYYLNLRGSPEAMEVAARENAASQEGIHDLEDVVKRIARTEKIDESKELAGDIQDSLAHRIQRTARPVKNRGVRKAPFVVLIGADMPSILTEISFLSNPTDEQLLKKPEHRQRVAEGLYQGVAEYLQSLNSMTVNSAAKANRIPAVASIEQSRNQK